MLTWRSVRADKKSKELVQDFGLHDHGVLEKKLNGFMAHIGVSGSPDLPASSLPS